MCPTRRPPRSGSSWWTTTRCSRPAGPTLCNPCPNSSSTARIVVLTASPSDRVLVGAMEAGAAGFIAKTQRLEDVIAGVRAAAQGESVVSAKLLTRLLPRLNRQSAGSRAELTEREREILDLLARGLSNADIAQHLTISVHTVRNHVANLSAKLGAHSKLEALSIAVREGLVDGG